jgi:hypothetical protein
MSEPIAGILVAHLVGDYLLQTDHMATEKTQRWLPAWLHAITYTLPFMFITLSIPALLVICVTHAIIDHYRLVFQFIWAKNNLLVSRDYRYRWRDSVMGAPAERPAYISFWVMVVCDNTAHVLINIAAINCF